MTPVKLHRLTPALALTPLLVLLAGCGVTTTQLKSTTSTGYQLSGGLHGGQQPIGGARIYVMAAGQSGYGSSSVSLIDPATPGSATDASGTYVLTDANGSFHLPDGSFTCNASQQIYVLSRGGAPGPGININNEGIGLMAPVGSCSSSPGPYLFINEMSTVVSAYALAGFMTDITHLGSTATPLALNNIGNAFYTIFNIENISTGQANQYNQAGNGVVPQATLNTLADILAPCVNSTGTGTVCSSLFANAKDANGNVPTNTLDAILNIAHNPAANVSALFGLTGTTPPFAPTLATAPNDWTIGVTYYADNMAGPYYPAFDASGNLWVPDYANNTITEFDFLGDPLSLEAGYSGGGLNEPVYIAIDSSSNAWVANFSATGSPALSEFNSSGAGIGSYSSGPSCFAVAVDASQNIWTACSNNISVANQSGHSVATTTATTFNTGLAIDSNGGGWAVGSGGKLDHITGASTLTQVSQSVAPASGTDLNLVAIDSSNNIWFASGKNSTLGEYDSSGHLLSPAAGYTGGGLSSPAQIAIDGSNRVFVANRTTNSISVFSNTGAAISPSTGYIPSGQVAPDSTVPADAVGLSSPHGVAIDGGGNVWVTNFTGNSVTEFLGLATPVVTPMSPTTHGQRP